MQMSTLARESCTAHAEIAGDTPDTAGSRLVGAGKFHLDPQAPAAAACSRNRSRNRTRSRSRSRSRAVSDSAGLNAVQHRSLWRKALLMVALLTFNSWRGCRRERKRDRRNDPFHGAGKPLMRCLRPVKQLTWQRRP